MRNKASIFLVGPSGAGKSTIGLELAEALKMEFYDTDQVIESRTGVSISWIYDVEGEEGFHKRQTEVLRELVEKPNCVLATGGDVVLKTENRNLLAGRGLVVYLTASIDQQLERTQRKDHRPLLQVDDVEGKLEEMKADREPLYEEIADVTFDTAGHSVRAVTRKIMQHLEEQGY
ncbi:MAG: shikimate kinase AroK [Gammaproteobacteria bacterium CG11_big_fil_rev_8_21_14_0_20_46_22]|nr:MAG: shikimate kinase AroK [Gammaproteobacteria bacterium CG12_big_fil_rev_8_21_14_0_65_46_12]PIR12066.1 MAG: shikimate kinase AroK [Gammaproteobacteria bacterium CG11_big_fil_rev_8_21_14_0_20_46_22]